MKSGSVADGSAGCRQRPARRLMTWFFAAWTVVVILSVWWLLAKDSNRADFLIALDRSDLDSWFAQARVWIETHVEVYWIYPWILLAPYVLGFGLKFPIGNGGLAWRLALHLVLGAGFVSGSRALTNRLETIRPRALVLKGEEVVRRMTKDGSNDTTNVALTWSMEWPNHGRQARIHRLTEDSTPVGAVSNSLAGTNIDTSSATGRTKVLIWRADGDPLSDFEPPPTNLIFNAALTNAAAWRLASRLAPLIEEEMKALRDHRVIAAPRTLPAALDGLAYLALLGLAQALHFRRRLDEREHQAALLESKLTHSRLHALQAQLQPHFLFNALNGIATLVRRDPRIAEEMLTSLSDLLRVSLAQSGRQELSLREELRFLERYLELQEMRFGDRLRVERLIAPEALGCLVPSFLLQPLVENAIRHGIEPSPNPGIVRIRAERRDGQVLLAVEDNGCGLNGQTPLTTGGNGIGLNSVRERLAGLYGDSHEFALQENPGGGVGVRITIPARLATATDESPAVKDASD